MRIGIGIAQGLALGAELPMIGVSTLATMAEGARRKSGPPVCWQPLMPVWAKSTGRNISVMPTASGTAKRPKRSSNPTR